MYYGTQQTNFSCSFKKWYSLFVQIYALFIHPNRSIYHAMHECHFPPMISEFPSQRVGNGKTFPFDDVIMQTRRLTSIWITTVLSLDQKYPHQQRRSKYWNRAPVTRLKMSWMYHPIGLLLSRTCIDCFNDNDQFLPRICASQGQDNLIDIGNVPPSYLDIGACLVLKWRAFRLFIT